MKIVIEIPEDKVLDKLNEAIIIIAKLRHHGKLWKRYFGSAHHGNLKRWEQKADEFLNSLSITEIQPDE